jgi:hypothetical protein
MTGVTLCVTLDHLSVKQISSSNNITLIVMSIVSVKRIDSCLTIGWHFWNDNNKMDIIIINTPNSVASIQMKAPKSRHTISF